MAAQLGLPKICAALAICDALMSQPLKLQLQARMKHGSLRGDGSGKRRCDMGHL